MGLKFECCRHSGDKPGWYGSGREDNPCHWKHELASRANQPRKLSARFELARRRDARHSRNAEQHQADEGSERRERDRESQHGHRSCGRLSVGRPEGEPEHRQDGGELGDTGHEQPGSGEPGPYPA